MFTVTGTICSVPYRVGIHDGPVAGEMHGCVMGSDNATALLSAHVGEYMRQTPTHSAVRLNLGDPQAVLAALHELTSVNLVEGTLPWQAERVLPDTIYRLAGPSRHAVAAAGVSGVGSLRARTGVAVD